MDRLKTSLSVHTVRFFILSHSSGLDSCFENLRRVEKFLKNLEPPWAILRNLEKFWEILKILERNWEMDRNDNAPSHLIQTHFARHLVLQSQKCIVGIYCFFPTKPYHHHQKWREKSRVWWTLLGLTSFSLVLSYCPQLSLIVPYFPFFSFSGPYVFLFFHVSLKGKNSELYEHW